MPQDPDGYERPITLKEMGEVNGAEKSTPSLTPLPAEFYEKATSYLKSLIAMIENEKSAHSTPYEKQPYPLTQEYQRAKSVLENIYNTRERKILLAALNASRGIKQKLNHMENEEEDLFFTLKVELENGRDRTLRYDRLHQRPEIIRGESGFNTSTDDFLEPGSSEDVIGGAIGEKEPIQKADGESSGGAADEKNEGASRDEHGPGDRMVVRALADIDTFVTPDGRTLSMRKEDVSTLQESVASLLIEAGMVEIVRE